MQVKVSHSTLCNPMEFAVHGILQARILELVVFPFSRGSSQPRDRTQVSHTAGDSLPAEPQGKPKNTGVGSPSLRQRIFPIQELNWSLLHCQRRQWHPTPVLLPGKSHGRRSLVGGSPWGREESDMTERLHFHFSLSCIGEGNGNPLQYSCLENPRDGGAWWAAIYGIAQSWTRLKWLSSSFIAGRFFTICAIREAQFASEDTNKGLIFKIYKQLIQFNRKTK